METKYQVWIRDAHLAGHIIVDDGDTEDDVIEFATHGKATPTSTSAYIENRISWMAYNRAVKRGMDIYMANAPRAETFDGVVNRASDHSEYLEYKREIMEIDEKSAQEELCQ